jgi:hypothetical protein
MPTLIDIDPNEDIKSITASPGGVTTNGLRVVIGANISKADAHKGLLAITNVLIGDQIQLGAE